MGGVTAKVLEHGRLAAGLVAVALLAAGCGQGAAAARAQGEDFPVTVDSCGQELTLDRPPERVVAIHQNLMELALKLGQEDRLVGWVQYGPLDPLPDQREAFERIPKLAELEVSTEVIASADPDLVLSNDPLPELEGLGIPVWNPRLYCPHEDGNQGDPAAIEGILEDVGDLGAMFGVPDRAEALIADARARLAEVEEAVAGAEPLPVGIFYFFAEINETPSTYAGNSVLSDVVQRAGGANVFADVPTVYTEASREEFIDRAPQWLVLVDFGATGATPQEVAAHLREDPQYGSIPAVRDRQFITVTFDGVLPNLRFPEYARQIAEKLHPEAFT